MSRKTKKIRRRAIKGNIKDVMVALLLQKVMPFRPQPLQVKKKGDVTARALKITSLRSLTIIIIRNITALEIISCQKISYSIGNLYINNLQLRDFTTYILYLVCSSVIKEPGYQT